MKKHCTICNKEYYVPPNRVKQSKFCSNQCHGISDKLYKTRHTGKYVNCYICKTPIYRTLNRLKKHKYQFCSYKCVGEFAKSDKNPRKLPKERKCVICNKVYSVANYLKQKCCSLECGYEYNRRFFNIKLSDEQKSKVNKVCLSCGKSFRVWNYRKRSQFCSKFCKNEFNRIEKICRTCGDVFIVPKYLKSRIYCSERCSSKGVGKRKSIFFTETFERLKCKYKNIKSEELIRSDHQKYFCDILINDKIIIECFGDYWHCNPLKFDELYYHTKIGKTAKEIWERDKLRIDNFIKLGYTIIILWENNYKENIDLIEDILYEICKNKKNNAGGEKRHFSFNGGKKS